MVRALMFQGTGSDVGKSVLVAGLCRLARRLGLKVAPFKPQNMSNNAAVADDGGEIGRAQALQALACGLLPSVHMNPVLLKPQSDHGSQIVVQGKMWGQARGRDYQKLKPQLIDAVIQSFEQVSQGVDLVLVEGAGSPAEINLRAGDIANMGFATRAGVPVILVGDIDRGGVIASLVGTHAVLDDRDRSMVAGFLINKFRGDVSLFDDGIAGIVRHTGWPCFGVVPWLEAASRLPAEDSVVLERLRPLRGGRKRVSVFVLDRIANFDEFDAFAAEPEVDVTFVRPGDRLPPDTVLAILPGSKSTISDLERFRANGWDADLTAHLKRGGHVFGVCGGYQMLGRAVADPLRIEGGAAQTQGLGLLDVETEMAQQKIVRNVAAIDAESGEPLAGYEIHLGRTHGSDCARPVTMIDGVADGASSADGRVRGTYLHGIFGNGAFRRSCLQAVGIASRGADHAATVEQALDEIAAELEKVVDFDRLFTIPRAASVCGS